AAVGVGDHEAGAMQREPAKRVLRAKDPVVLALAVANIADERAADVLQVAADLVQPAGVEPGLDQRVAAKRLAPPDLGPGGDALLAGGARDRMVDHQV